VSRPSWVRIAALTAAGAREPRMASMGSPGVARSSKNTAVVIVHSISGARSNRTTI